MKDNWQKRVFSLLLLCLLLTGTVSAAKADGTPVFQEILTQMGPLTPIAQTHYVLAQEVKSGKWGLFNTDGEQLIPYEYTSISYLSYQCFDVGKNTPIDPEKTVAPQMEDVNSHALIAPDGTRVTDFLYGTFKVFSPDWACGWVLESSSEEDSDYQLGRFFYRVKQYDVFWLGDHALSSSGGPEQAYLAASLTRDQFKDAAAHGPFLYIQDREDVITAYNSAFEPLDLTIGRMNESMYGIKNWAIVARDSGDMLLDGFSAVEEAVGAEGTLLKVTRLDYSGNKWFGIYTVDGEELMPLTLDSISSVTGDYVLLANRGKKGLYSLRENRLLLPCAYDNIIASNTTVDPYVLHGYLCAEANGERFYIDAETGKRYPADNAAKDRTRLGNTYFSNLKRVGYTMLYAPDGTETKFNDGYIENVRRLRGSGYLFSADTDYKHMLITWKGEVLLKFYNNPFVITDDDSVIIETVGGGYKMGKVVDSEE